MESSEDAGRYPSVPGLSTGGDEVDGVARRAGVVGGATAASRVLGLARDVVLLNLFQRGPVDAFVVAFMIPNLFRRLVGEGTLTVAFVPVFTGWLRRSRAEARRAFDATWTLAAVVGGVIAVAGIALAGPLAAFFAPGFALQPGKLELCAELLRLCFPYIFFLTLVAVAMGALNACGHFFAPAIAPVLLNVCLIAGAGAAFLWLDASVVALGWAVIVAGALQVLIQLPPLRRLELAPRPRLEPGHPAVRRLGRVMAPAVLGASVYQVNILVVRFLASTQGDGAVAYLYAADRLVELPLGVFVFALGTASLPSLSRLAKSGDAAGLRRAFAGTLRLTLALALPSAAGLIALREPIFGALFAWNTDVFGADAIEACARALLFYAVGLPAIAAARIYVQVCMAHENARSPARAAAVSLGVNAVAALALIGPIPEGVLPGLAPALGALRLLDLGFAGLALATSIAAAANAAYLIAAARRRYGALLDAGDLLALLRLAVAAAAAGAVVLAGERALPVPPGASLRSWATLALHVTLGVCVYAGALAALRSPELWRVLAMARRRPASGGGGEG